MSRSILPGIEPAILTVRVPLLPARVGRDLLAADDPLASTRTLLQESTLFDGAVYLASPSLHDALAPWVTTGESKKSHAPLRALAYALRMATRATPFGLFAGIGSVTGGEPEKLALSPLEATRFVAYPNASWLAKVYERLERDPQLRACLPVVSNDVRLTRGHRLYWGDPKRLKRGIDPVDPIALQYETVSARESEALDRVVAIASVPRALNDLCREVSRELEMPQETAIGLVERLLGLGLLLFVRPMGRDGFDLMERLAIEQRAPIAEEFALAKYELSKLNARSLTQLDRNSLERCRASLLSIQDSDKTPFQIDVLETVAGALPAQVLSDVGELSRLMLASAQMRSLDEYRARFLRHYEGDSRRVPLLELVDPNVGIGMPQDTTQQRPDRDEGRNDLRFDIASRALRDRSLEVEMTDEDVAKLFPNPDQTECMKHGWEIGFQIVAGSAEEVAAGNYLIRSVPTLSTDGPFKTINRFARHADPEMGRTFDALSRCAEPGPLPVELAFASDSHYANLLQVPQKGAAVASRWEGLPDEVTRIEPRDIVIGLEEGRFAAYSHALQRRLLVRESYMFYVPYFAAPHIRLLSLIGKQDHVQPAAFDWGNLRHVPFLPRLRYGRLVISPARWSVSREEIRSNKREIGKYLRDWRTEWNVPRYICLVERDLRMPVDLESVVAGQMILDNVTPPSDGYPIDSHMRFEEMLPDFDHAWLDRRGERHFHEFVAGFAPVADQVALAVPDLDVVSGAPKGPGSEWIFAKIYAGRSELDAVLQSIVPDVLKATADLQVDRWFFLRYADPDPHIRLRMRSQGDPMTLLARVASLLTLPLASRMIQRYAFDTYQPETEKYGGTVALDLAETLFAYDSRHVLEIIKAGALSWEQRIAYSMEAVAATLTCWFKYFGVATWLNKHEREARAVRPIDWSRVKRLRQSFIESRGLHDEASAAVAALRDLHERGSLKASPEQIVDHLLHMHFNRIGVSMQEEAALRAAIWHACHGLEKEGRECLQSA